MKRGGPLKRKTPLRRKKVEFPDRAPQPPVQKRKPLKRTRLRKESPKKKLENAAYNKRVVEWKWENPVCSACFRLGHFPAQPTRDCHHMMARGKHLMDEEFWLPVCRRCHDWIEAHKNSARELKMILYK